MCVEHGELFSGEMRGGPPLLHVSVGSQLTDQMSTNEQGDMLLYILLQRAAASGPCELLRRDCICVIRDFSGLGLQVRQVPCRWTVAQWCR